MAKNKKVEISLEEKLEKVLVSVEEQPYKIPDNWVWTRLGKVAKLSGGSGFPEKYQGFLDKNIPFYKVGSLKNIDDNFYIENSENYIDKNILDEIKAKLFPKNTIIFAKIGEAIRLNRRAILKEKSCIDNNLMALVSNSSSYFRYIYFWLKKEDLYKYAQATTVPSIRQSTLEELEFPLPPLNEQKRIVEKLDFLFEKTKRAKEIIEEIKVDIENRKISILDRAFKGILTSKWRNENKTSDVRELLKSINDEKIKKWKEDCLQAEKEGSKKPKKPIIREVEDMIVPVEEQPYKLPDSWLWVRLGDIIDNIKYGFNASGQENGDVKLLRITDIQNDDVNWDNVPYCKISEEEYETYQLKVRDILIVRTGGTIGKTFLIRKIPKNLKSVYASYLIKFYPNKNISEIYLKNYFNTDFYWKLLKMKSRGTGQPNVNSPSLQALLIPLPPLEEQKEIVRVLDEVLENENKVKELLELEERIDILEKSILNKAFRGELRTQNSSDEPTIELLKEIL